MHVHVVRHLAISTPVTGAGFITSTRQVRSGELGVVLLSQVDVGTITSMYVTELECHSQQNQT